MVFYYLPVERKAYFYHFSIKNDKVRINYIGKWMDVKRGLVPRVVYRSAVATMVNEGT